MKVTVVILAAGQGKRMHSDLPKPLHTIGGVPMLEHVVNAAKALNPEKVIVVYGGQGDLLKDRLSYLDVEWVEQSVPKGTGDAVKKALPQIADHQSVLVLCGDVPLVNSETLKKLIEKTGQAGIGWVTAHVDQPKGLGRIVRDDDHNPIAIVEERDADINQQKINEINTGICLIPTAFLKKGLPQLKADNAQGEYYLTDLFHLGVKEGLSIQTVSSEHEYEILGVNNRAQLAYLERVYQRNRAAQFMLDGLTLADPERFDVRGSLTFGRDSFIDVNVIIEGEVKIGAHCHIGSHVVLRNVTLGDYTCIDDHSILQEAIVGRECKIGPFARLRPDAELADGVKIGNFVEIKKSKIGEQSKVNHLSYIGDAEVGKKVNVGAGSITCNYDGVNKTKTVIKDEAFIGSDTKFVSPVVIGKGATIGAGSVITQDCPDNKLTLARTQQITIDHWVSPKERLKKERN